MRKNDEFAHLTRTGIFDLLTKLLVTAKSAQTDDSHEYERLRTAPKGTRRVDDIEF